VLAFPGIFRGVLDARIKVITPEIKVAAANAIASYVTDAELSTEYIMPNAFDKGVAVAVGKAVAACK
jgi:malate dehydrogenase (oxaloacetate-decarboxylating)